VKPLSGPLGVPAPRRVAQGVSHLEFGAGAGMCSTLLLGVDESAQSFLRKRPAWLKEICSHAPGILHFFCCEYF
jgi:hypothetical protein